mmetsp:Transcript_14150/g.46365  ORF Transcript_14150/g.46365 Transcript_14150/m.46365 type:complete len:321 (+) Transcript_14150:442-1404(+)
MLYTSTSAATQSLAPGTCAADTVQSEVQGQFISSLDVAIEFATLHVPHPIIPLLDVWYPLSHPSKPVPVLATPAAAAQFQLISDQPPPTSDTLSSHPSPTISSPSEMHFAPPSTQFPTRAPVLEHNTSRKRTRTRSPPRPPHRPSSPPPAPPNSHQHTYSTLDTRYHTATTPMPSRPSHNATLPHNTIALPARAAHHHVPFSSYVAPYYHSSLSSDAIEPPTPTPALTHFEHVRQHNEHLISTCLDPPPTPPPASLSHPTASVTTTTLITPPLLLVAPPTTPPLLVVAPASTTSTPESPELPLYDRTPKTRFWPLQGLFP